MTQTKHSFGNVINVEPLRGQHRRCSSVLWGLQLSALTDCDPSDHEWQQSADQNGDTSQTIDQSPAWTSSHHAGADGTPGPSTPVHQQSNVQHTQALCQTTGIKYYPKSISMSQNCKKWTKNRQKLQLNHHLQCSWKLWQQCFFC